MWLELGVWLGFKVRVRGVVRIQSTWTKVEVLK